MKFHRLSRRIHIGPCGLRLGRLAIEPNAQTGHVHYIWFRKGLNTVWSHPYRKPKTYPETEYITVYHQLPELNRDLDPNHAYAIGAMLNAYCEWLNVWMAHNDQDPHHYRPTVFLDFDYDKHLYGSTHILGIYETDHMVYALSVYDGDDGGAAYLTGYFHEGTDLEGNRYFHLDNMTQEFDTMLTIVMAGGKLEYHGNESPT